MSTEPKGPEDPMTELAAGAVQIHELFQAYVAAGFTAEQALRLVMTLLRGSIDLNRGEG